MVGCYLILSSSPKGFSVSFEQFTGGYELIKKGGEHGWR